LQPPTVESRHLKSGRHKAFIKIAWRSTIFEYHFMAVEAKTIDDRANSR